MTLALVILYGLGYGGAGLKGNGDAYVLYSRTPYSLPGTIDRTDKLTVTASWDLLSWFFFGLLSETKLLEVKDDRKPPPVRALVASSFLVLRLSLLRC